MERTRSPTNASRRALVGPLVLGAVIVSSGRLEAQLATVRVEENFRAEPNGTVLARLLPGTALAVEGRGERWVEITVDGWVWTRSLQVTQQGGFDLVVSVAEGENLRARPQGPVLARLERGTLLRELERIPGWVHVRRRGWVWAASVDVEEAPDAAGVPSEGTAAPDRGAAGDPGTVVLTVPREGTPVLAAPDGDTLARAGSGAELELVERRGGWARVRLEGWIWVPPGAEGPVPDSAREEGPAPTPDSVRRAPSRWGGRVVTWELQFVSLERAERVRTDFFENEPFLLTRLPGREGGFVYVAVPPDRMTLVEGLTPLQTLRVTGRIRTGASALTGNPILDLMDLRRIPGGGFRKPRQAPSTGSVVLHGGSPSRLNLPGRPVVGIPSEGRSPGHEPRPGFDALLHMW